MAFAEQLLLDRRSHVLVRAGPRHWVRLGKKRMIVLQLALMTGMEFLENIMFVFGSRYTMTGLGVSPRNFALVQAAYATGSMLMIVAQQRLARDIGYRHYMGCAVGLFLVGTLSGAWSDTLAELTVARFLQGLGGGALFTSSRILVNVLFSEPERALPRRALVVSVFLAITLAPLLASTLLHYFTWRALFYGVVPFALLAFVGSLTLLPSAEPRGRAQHGIVPFLLFAAAVIAMQCTVSQLRFDLFAHPVRLTLTTLFGTLALVGFLVHQWHDDTPWVRLKPLGNRAYLAGLGSYFLYYLLATYWGYLFPIFSEKALGFSVQSTGALSAFSGLVSLVAVLVYLRVAEDVEHKKPLMVAGALSLSFAALWFAQMSPHASTLDVLIGQSAKGLFGVLLAIPIAAVTFRELREEHLAHGYQTKNLLRQLSISWSSALAAVLLDNREVAVKDGLSQGLGQESGALAGVLEQRALISATQDLFLLLGALALFTALVLLLQRRLP
jgi:MFS family permease